MFSKTKPFFALNRQILAGQNMSRILILPFLVFLQIGLNTMLLGQELQIEHSKIDFIGNETFPKDSLARAIFNRETRCRSFFLAPFCALGMDFSIDRQMFNRREITGDIFRLRSYYGSRGFKEVQVDTVITQLENKRVSTVFQINEGMPVRISKLDIQASEILENLDVLADLPTQEGDLFSSVKLDETRDTLIYRLQNRGYPRADVMRTSLIPTKTPYNAQVTFQVEEGPHAVFGPITLLGNQKLSEDVIRRILPFEEGDEYSQTLRVEAQRNLYSIDIIQNASIDEAIDPTESFPDTIFPVQVRVSEAEVHRIRTGAGWSTADCLNVEGRWINRNFLGGGRRLQVRGRLSNIMSEKLQNNICGQSGVGDFGGLNWLMSVDFSQPWIFSQRFTLNASLFQERQSLQDVFVRQAVGFDLSLSRSLGLHTSLSLTYRPEITQLEAAEVFFCITFLVCTPEDISGLQDPNWLAPVSLNIVRDRTNSILNPTKGYQLFLSVESASRITGSNFDYNRILIGGTKYQQINSEQVLAIRLQGGWVGSGAFSLLSGRADIIHPQKRFYSGGSNSVRGFAQNQLGPRVLAVDVSRLLSSVPERSGTPCMPSAILDLTCDANFLDHNSFGTPRPTGGDLVIEGGIEYRMRLAPRLELAVFTDLGRIWSESDSGNENKLEVTPGLGVRYLSPVGPVRIDLGYRFSGSQDLRVVTSQIRPFNSENDQKDDRITRFVNGAEEAIDFVLVDELAVLKPLVSFGPTRRFSPGRLQLHFSIGQAF